MNSSYAAIAQSIQVLCEAARVWNEAQIVSLARGFDLSVSRLRARFHSLQNMYAAPHTPEGFVPPRSSALHNAKTLRNYYEMHRPLVWAEKILWVQWKIRWVNPRTLNIVIHRCFKIIEP